MRAARNEDRRGRPGPRRSTGTVAACLVVSGLSLALGSGCGKEKVAANTSQEQTVTTTQPKVQPLRRYINQPGIVQPYEETPIYPKLAGFLQDVRVDIGDKITKNSLLCKIWVPEIEEAVAVKRAKIVQGEADVKQSEENLKASTANVTTWEANVREAKASLIRAHAFLVRWEDELKRDIALGVLSKETLEETRHQRDAAEAAEKEAVARVAATEAALVESKARKEQASVDVEVAKATLAVWRAEYREQVAWFGYAEVTAPYNGIVTLRSIHTGHFVQPVNSGTTSKAADPLFVVMRTDIMRVVVQVPEYDAPLVKDGADAIVRLQAYRGEDIKCKVTRSSWSLDEDVRTLRVEIFLNNPNPQLRSGEDLQPGMYGNISIAADLPDALTLPSRTILTDGNRKFVFVMEDGKARRVNVKVGINNDTTTEVLMKQAPPTKVGEEGAWVKFTGNEQIITSNNLKSIQDGQPAKIQNGEPAK